MVVGLDCKQIFFVNKGKDGWRTSQEVVKLRANDASIHVMLFTAKMLMPKGAFDKAKTDDVLAGQVCWTLREVP
jgi:hypothetical protein